jgi:hypothetical protein
LVDGIHYVVYGMDVKGKGIKFSNKNDLIDFMQDHGHSWNGRTHAGDRRMPQLWNQPKFKGITGPMYDGAGINRYETPRVYKRLSV